MEFSDGSMASGTGTTAGQGENNADGGEPSAVAEEIVDEAKGNRAAAAAESHAGEEVGEEPVEDPVGKVHAADVVSAAADGLPGHGDPAADDNVAGAGDAAGMPGSSTALSASTTERVTAGTGRATEMRQSSLSHWLL